MTEAEAREIVAELHAMRAEIATGADGLKSEFAGMRADMAFFRVAFSTALDDIAKRLGADLAEIAAILTSKRANDSPAP